MIYLTLVMMFYQNLFMRRKNIQHFARAIAAMVIILPALIACQPAEATIHYGGQLYAQEFLLQGMDAWSPYNLNIEHVLFFNPDDLA